VKLADQGYFWTGVERKKMPYGTIATGQMYVQYFVPAEVRYPHPIVLIHGGGGQATHMMGVGRRPGWLHYFIQAGYRVYMVDRPAWGRVPYHPDAFDASHLGLFSTYERLNVFRTPQWPGPTGQIGDPLVDQFIPNEIGAPSEEAIDSTLFVKAGAALLDKIGPAILLTHAFSGSLGWALADRRPALVKGIVAVEANGVPFGGQLQWGLTSVPVAWDPPVSGLAQLSLVDVKPAPSSPGVPTYKLQSGTVRRLKNLQGIPIAWVTGELRGASNNGNNGPAQVAFLRQAGCAAEHVPLKDRGIVGNGNLMLIEKNNKQVFDVIAGWLAKSVAAPSGSRA
jgi:pimeloyl-ACP methyl ester carboxylesterase